jgi:hypothetical protein
MRYRETGEVHMDFHRTTNGTISYLRRTHGVKFLDEVFRRTAQDVYRAIWEDLKRGRTTHLVRHWRHFFDREKGKYSVRRGRDEVRLTVTECPAVAYLRRRGIRVDPAFCRQTVAMNRAWSEGTPFEITTELLGEGRCVQTLRRVRP